MKNNWLRVISLMVLFGLVVGISYTFRGQVNVATIHDTVASYGIWAPLVFIVIYAFATVFFLPGSVLTLAGGFIFGPWWGTLYNLTGAVLGATGAFLVARYLAQDWVAEKVGGRLQGLILGVEKQGWRFVAIVRLVPLIPFNLLNYALGLTRIRLLHYVWASAVFMLPGGFAYTYVGSLGKTALAGEAKALVTQASIAIGLLIIVASIPWLVRHLKKDLPDD